MQTEPSTVDEPEGSYYGRQGRCLFSQEDILLGCVETTLALWLENSPGSGEPGLEISRALSYIIEEANYW